MTFSRRWIRFCLAALGLAGALGAALFAMDRIVAGQAASAGAAT